MAPIATRTNPMIHKMGTPSSKPRINKMMPRMIMEASYPLRADFSLLDRIRRTGSIARAVAQVRRGFARTAPDSVGRHEDRRGCPQGGRGEDHHLHLPRRDR